MIFGKLSEIDTYKGLPEIYEQLVVLKQIYESGEEIKPQHIDLHEKSFINILDSETKHVDPPVPEVHHRALDVHCLFKGEEAIWYGDESEAKIDGVYDEKGDIAFYTGRVANVCRMKPGEFMVVFPEELHSPLNSSNGCDRVVKAVGKIFVK